MKTALIIVNVQQDFCPGGAMAVQEGDHVVDPVNQLVRYFEAMGLPIYFTREWHPVNHCSFEAQGGPWPPHCVAGSAGAQFHAALQVPADAAILCLATRPEADACSGFEGTDLELRLKRQGVKAVVVAGLATDHAVKKTALDAHRLGFAVTVAIDAVRAVNAKPDDGRCAIKHMQIRGIDFADTDDIVRPTQSK